MEVVYQKMFLTKLSEYQLQLEITPGGRNYITFCRYLADKNREDPCENIHINPEILNDLIDSLQDCMEYIDRKPFKKYNRFPLEKKEEIIFRYLRGISINDLCIQFDTMPEKIEKVLFDANIPIIDPNSSKPPRTYWRNRKKPNSSSKK